MFMQVYRSTCYVRYKQHSTLQQTLASVRHYCCLYWRYVLQESHMVVQHQILHDFLQGNGNLKHWISAINSAASSKIGWIPMEVCIYSRTTFKRKPLRPHWHRSKQIPRLSVKINRIQLFCKKKAKYKAKHFQVNGY